MQGKLKRNILNNPFFLDFKERLEGIITWLEYQQLFSKY